jgi:hypothetical protein
MTASANESDVGLLMFVIARDSLLRRIFKSWDPKNAMVELLAKFPHQTLMRLLADKNRVLRRAGEVIFGLVAKNSNYCLEVLGTSHLETPAVARLLKAMKHPVKHNCGSDRTFHTVLRLVLECGPNRAIYCGICFIAYHQQLLQAEFRHVFAVFAAGFENMPTRDVAARFLGFGPSFKTFLLKDFRLMLEYPVF